MTIWDSLTGRRSQQSTDTQTSGFSGGISSGGGVTFQPTGFDPSTAQDVSSFLNEPGALDPSSLHPLAGLNQDTLDYLSLDDSALSQLPGSRSVLPSRGWSDDLCYGT